MESLSQIRDHISHLPFCETFLCLCRKEKLRDGVMPQWFTGFINWLTDNQ